MNVEYLTIKTELLKNIFVRQTQNKYIQGGHEIIIYFKKFLNNHI